MLHLNRKTNEVIYIQDNKTGSLIELVVLGFQRKNGGMTVKLGFVDDAKNYTFLRKEVAMRKEHEDLIKSGKTSAEIGVVPNPFFRDNIPTWYGTPSPQEKVVLDEVNRQLSVTSQEENRHPFSIQEQAPLPIDAYTS